MNPFWAGVTMSVSMFWEAVSEPLMGHISDNTRSRWGRRHPHMVLGGGPDGGGMLPDLCRSGGVPGQPGMDLLVSGHNQSRPAHRVDDVLHSLHGPGFRNLQRLPGTLPPSGGSRDLQHAHQFCRTCHGLDCFLQGSGGYTRDHRGFQPPEHGSMVETFGQWFPFREPRSGFCPKARGYAVCGVTPGMGGRCITTPKVVVPGDRTGALTRSGCGVVMQINRARCPIGPIEPPPANLPGFYDGTTLSGLFLYPQSTHGSTSAVQPWALWQNPVGIPGRDRGVVGGLLMFTAS